MDEFEVRCLFSNIFCFNLSMIIPVLCNQTLLTFVGCQIRH